eukprot:scaffold7346_cov245-Pinguiococcus_pyrenoidosus.AAC.28
MLTSQAVQLASRAAQRSRGTYPRRSPERRQAASETVQTSPEPLRSRSTVNNGSTRRKDRGPTRTSIGFRGLRGDAVEKRLSKTDHLRSVGAAQRFCCVYKAEERHRSPHCGRKAERSGAAKWPKIFL